MTSLLPESAEEALSIFSEEDSPPDCHRHCSHWESEGECCECGETEARPFKDVLAKHLEEFHGQD